MHQETFTSDQLQRILAVGQRAITKWQASRALVPINSGEAPPLFSGQWLDDLLTLDSGYLLPQRLRGYRHPLLRTYDAVKLTRYNSGTINRWGNEKIIACVRLPGARQRRYVREEVLAASELPDRRGWIPIDTLLSDLALLVADPETMVRRWLRSQWLTLKSAQAADWLDCLVSQVEARRCMVLELYTQP